MQWKKAAELSPEEEAVRTHRPGQLMYRRPDGTGCMQEKPNYALYRDCTKRELEGHDDWEPLGWWDPKPEPLTADSDCGFLSPKGEFYHCHYHEHDALASGLVHRFGLKDVKTLDGIDYHGKEDALLASGWMTLRQRGGKHWWYNPIHKVTQRQRDTLWDWQQATGTRDFDMPLGWKDE